MINLTVTPSAARKRFDVYCLELNSRQSNTTYVRKTAQGEKTIVRRKKIISDGAQATGKAIIQLYASRMKMLQGILPENLINGTPPSLPTNNVKLAGYRQNVTDRTIRTHIQQLKAIGFISNYKFHGSKNNFELWLNTEIIFGAGFAVNVTEIPAFSEPAPSVRFPGSQAFASDGNEKKIPHKQTIETDRNKSTTISKAEKSHLYGNQNMETTPSGPEPCQNGMQEPKNGNKEGGAAAAANVDNSVDNFVRNRWDAPEPSPTFNALDPYTYRAVRTFWTYAHQSLWPDREFSITEYAKTAELITNGFFLPFVKTKPNKNQFDAFTDELLKAVDVARRYYQKHLEFHPGEPYSGTSFSNGYFDILNPRGFKIAVDWRFKNKAAADDAYGNRVINDALRHLQNHASGDLPKHLKGKTYLELYDHYCIKMQRFTPELRELFFRRVAALKGLDDDARFLAQLGHTKQKINLLNKY